MSDKGATRRLAAIMVADVVGYSRMMGADDSGTLAALKHHRETLFDPVVAAHNGRIVKLIGDGTLVEFASVIDAVNCALAIQRGVPRQAKSDNTITLRIGVNLGDVIIDGDDIYGDGVNVAARLEPLAEPGGICIASIVNESVANRVGVQFVDGGEVRLKNFDRPIRIWKWHPETDDGPAAARSAATGVGRPDKPSIAVLPFANMSGEPEQEYFSDGITDDIITDLSKVAGLLVIARNSSFAYKGKNVDIRTVGRDLGVRTVLEGSVRRAGDRVRITAQLIDAVTGGHLWAERYDRDLTDIFAVQDEVTLQIISALKVTLSAAEKARVVESETSNVEAHDAFLRGRELILAATKDRGSYELAIKSFNKAIALDPDYGAPYAGLAMAHNVDYHNHITDDGNNALDIAAGFAAEAIARSPNDPFALFVAAIVATFRGRFEDAATWADAAVVISPNYAPAHMARGTTDVYSGNPLSAIPQIELAIRLDPLHNQQYLHFVGTAYLTAGRYEAAAAVFKERIRVVPGSDLSRAFLASALGHAGQIAEAREIWREMMTINPKYSFDEHVGRLPFKNQADVDRIREGLTKAGLT
ncbi:MAG: adenylate/guanylate cyclase domain-containing protein [Salaquimonas sp.]|nr:adenylate/guanylate cyclase domain-containing protein [Salaquimonas sp.]